MTEFVDHVIEAKNLVLGNSRFLTLPLPDGWDLAPGVSRPEVSASHVRRDIRWVVHGDFWYVVFERDLGWAMEVYGRMRPASKRANTQKVETTSIGGHPAMVDWKVRRRGLPWKRHDVTYMTVEFECLPSERDILLEFSGWCPEEGFRQILRALNKLGCH
jgi:hypothetical protein